MLMLDARYQILDPENQYLESRIGIGIQRSRLRPAGAGLRRGKQRSEVRLATASPSNGGRGESVLRRIRGQSSQNRRLLRASQWLHVLSKVGLCKENTEEP
jgi:hypothetical protein